MGLCSSFKWFPTFRSPRNTKVKIGIFMDYIQPSTLQHKKVFKFLIIRDLLILYREDVCAAFVANCGLYDLYSLWWYMWKCLPNKGFHMDSVGEIIHYL